MWCHLLTLSTTEDIVIERHYLIHNWSSRYPEPPIIAQWPQEPADRHINLLEHIHVHGQGHTRLCLATRISAAKCRVADLLPFQTDWVMSGLHLLPFFDLPNNMRPYWMQLKRIAVPWENVTSEPT